MSQTDMNSDESGAAAEDLKTVLAEKQLELTSKTDAIKQAKETERLSVSAQKEFDKEQKEGAAPGFGAFLAKCGVFLVKYFLLLPSYMVLFAEFSGWAFRGVTDALSIDTAGWGSILNDAPGEGANETVGTVIFCVALASFLFFFTFLPYRAKSKKKAERQQRLDTHKEELQKLKLRIKELGIEIDKIQEEIEVIRLKIDDVKAQKLAATEQDTYLKAVARLKQVEELAEEKRNDWLTKSEASYKKLKGAVNEEIDQLAQLSKRHPSIGNFLMTRSIDDDNLDVFQRLDAIFDSEATVEGD
jgi:hypothetical protein